MDSLIEFGLGLIRSLQVFSPGLDGVMNAFTFLGKIEFYLLVVPFIYWTIDSRLGMRLLLILLSTDILASNLKLLLHQPRPYWVGGVQGLTEEASYGIPSSHASNSLSVWGYLAYRLKKTWAWIATITFVLFIGLSRLYLGVHFPHDVLFGWLIGALVLWIFIKYEARLSAWANAQATGKLIGVTLAISVTVILLGQLVQMIIAGTPDPAAWSAFSSESRAASHSFTLAGALFGSVAGYALMKRHAPMSSGGEWSNRIVRYALGIIGVLVLYFGMDVLFAMLTPDETALGYILRYLRYATVTFWVTFLAPWVFLKLGLAKR